MTARHRDAPGAEPGGDCVHLAAPVDAASVDDPIVAEVRAAREALFAEAGYDLEEFGRQIRASEIAEGVTSVVRPPRVLERP